jgi:hypothetical protein
MYGKTEMFTTKPGNATRWTLAAPYACYGSALGKYGSQFVSLPYPSGVS